MKKSTYILMPAALCGALLLAACGDSSSNTPQSNNPNNPPATQPGLAERTGRSIDNAADKTGDALKRAGDKVGDTSRDLANKTSDTADRVNDQTRADNTVRPAPAPDTGMGTTPGITSNQPVTTPPTTQPKDSTAKLPGLPSVTGTDTSNLSTADAAAQRLLDKAQVEAQKGDTDHVRRLVKELQEMRNNLSQPYQQKVDELAKAYPDNATNNPPTANDR